MEKNNIQFTLSFSDHVSVNLCPLVTRLAPTLLGQKITTKRE